MTRRLAVLGAGGQLGRAVLARASGWTVQGLTRDDVDARSPDGLAARLAVFAPEVVINCVALTNVDACEGEPDLAHQVNAAFAGHAAQVAGALGARFLHVSTDYVFGGGDQRSPLDETRPVAPVNIYGRTKADGEAQVLAASDEARVVRVSALFGPGGAAAKAGNFIDAILRGARTRDELTVVADQTISPTYAPFAADALLHLAEQGAPGLWHAAGCGAVSWFELAQAAIEAAGLTTPVRPITTADWPTAAPRPAYTALDGSKLDASGFVMPDWREGVLRYVAGVGA